MASSCPVCNDALAYLLWMPSLVFVFFLLRLSESGWEGRGEVRRGEGGKRRVYL